MQAFPSRFSGVGVERVNVGTRARGGGGREEKREETLFSPLPLLRFFHPRPNVRAVKNRKNAETPTELLTIATQTDLGAETFPNHDIV